MKKILVILGVWIIPLSALAYIDPPVGDEMGEYYRDRTAPKMPRETLPVKNEETHSALLSVLGEKDRTVRAQVLQALAAIADPKDIPAVLKLVDDPVPGVRREALKALAAMSEGDLEKAAADRIKKDPSAAVRRTAVFLLSELKIGASHMAEALGDRDAFVREAAVAGLGRIGGPVARERLPDMFEDRSANVRAACASALAEIRHPSAEKILVSGLSDSEEVVRGACALTLGRIGPEAAALVQVLLVPEETRYVLQCVLGSLGRNKVKNILPTVHGMLGHEDMGVRIAACGVCGSLEDPSSADPLGALLADEQYQVRHAAASALFEIGGEPAAAEFRGAMTHELATARREAAWGLGKMKHQESLSLLAEATTDKNEEVRVMSAWALGKLGNREGGDALCAAASDESPVVRAEAAKALGRADTPSGRTTLVRMLDDDDDKIRARAARSIGELKHPAAGAVIKVLNKYSGWSPMREDAAWALAELNAKEAIPHLRKILLEKVVPTPFGPVYDSAPTRIQVMKSLAKIGRDGLVEDLTDYGRLSDRSFMGGYIMNQAVAQILTQLTSRRYDWKRPAAAYKHWFIESLEKRQREEPGALVFPVEE